MDGTVKLSVTKQLSPHEDTRSPFISVVAEEFVFEKNVLIFEAYLYFIFCAIIRPKFE